MSGVVKTVKKAFKKNPVLTTIVVAAAVWFTAGTAAAYFAAPQAGMGAAMSTSATSMWTATTSAFAAEGAAVTTSGVEVGAVAGAGEGVVAGEAMAATEGVGALSASEAALTEASIAGTMPASATGAATTAGSTVAGGGGIINGAASWMGANPIPTMILGQAGVGAYQGYLDDKADRRADEQRKERGLMGVDWAGGYQGQSPGIVNSQQVAPQQTTGQAVAEPTVAAPTVAAQQPGNQTRRPVKKSNLPAMNKKGLVAPTQVA